MKRLTLQEIDSMTDPEKELYIEKRKKHLNAPTRQEIENLLDYIIENGAFIECDKIIAGQIITDG
jgi:hypothetical protein